MCRAAEQQNMKLETDTIHISCDATTRLDDQTHKHPQTDGRPVLSLISKHHHYCAQSPQPLKQTRHPPGASTPH